ncbi:hypothetical protein JCM5296_006365 [Sporobolomyces johnsonii]
MTLCSPPGPRLIRSSASAYCPVTALAQIPQSAVVLAASAASLQAHLLVPSPEHPSSRKWRIFARERIHRTVVDPKSVGQRFRALVVGGKEAALLEIAIGSTGPHIRFALDDYVGDGAFLGEHHVLLATLHNSIHIYDLRCRPSSSACPPIDPSSSPSPPDTPILSPVLTLHAPARPLLWAALFSQARYDPSPSSPAAEEGESATVRLAGGSLLGDVLVWDVMAVDHLLQTLGEGTARQATKQQPEVGELRRLEGHRGAIFALSFSPSSRYLASGSDDRTIRIWDLSKPSPSSSSRLEQASAEPATLWGHEGRVWRIDWVDETTLASVAEVTSAFALVVQIVSLKRFIAGRNLQTVGLPTSQRLGFILLARVVSFIPPFPQLAAVHPPLDLPRRPRRPVNLERRELLTAG